MLEEHREADGTWVVKGPGTPTSLWITLAIIVAILLLSLIFGTPDARVIVPILLVLMYPAMVIAANRTTVRIGRGLVSMQRGPLPPTASLRIPTREVTGFEHAQIGQRESSLYEIKVTSRTAPPGRMRLQSRDRAVADATVRRLNQMLAEMG
jgi:hypothetical protein